MPAPKEQPPRKLSGRRTVRFQHSGERRGRAPADGIAISGEKDRGGGERVVTRQE